VALRHVLFYER